MRLELKRLKDIQLEDSVEYQNSTGKKIKFAGDTIEEVDELEKDDTLSERHILQ